MPNILLISGSPSASSKSKAILDHARQRLTAENLDTHTVSVRDFPPEDLLWGKYESPAFDAIKQRVAEADGLIVCTPIYKASYTGALKALLDILPTAALRSKTVLPVATGGSPAHLLALDYALKPVLSVLGATDLLQGVYIIDGQIQIDAAGQPSFDPDLRERFHTGIAHLVSNVRARVASSFGKRIDD